MIEQQRKNLKLKLTVLYIILDIEQIYNKLLSCN